MAGENRALLVSYQRERDRIDALVREDPTLRICPPANAHKAGYERLLAGLEPLLVCHRLIGYHCTRLTSSEVVSIRRDGLHVLSPDLVRRRLLTAVADGHIAQDDCEYVLGSESVKSNLSDKPVGRRTGSIALCPNRSSLRKSYSVFRLFRSWGGEAVYSAHEEDERVRHVLAIGVPCIVQCAVPFDGAKRFSATFSALFVSQFVRDAVEYPDPDPGFDLFVDRNIEASNVLSIIQFHEPRFAELTRYATWPSHQRIEV